MVCIEGKQYKIVETNVAENEDGLRVVGVPRNISCLGCSYGIIETDEDQEFDMPCSCSEGHIPDINGDCYDYVSDGYDDYDEDEEEPEEQEDYDED